MDFEFSEQQNQIRDSINKLCSQFGDQFWLDRDNDGEFPETFCSALAKDGWLGICMPEEVGGSGLGISEAAVMVQAISESGAANGGVSSIAIPLFGVNPIAVYGSDEQKQRMLPPVMRREDIPCFAVTEPNTGLDTTRLKTQAVLKGDRYIVHGQKVWTSTAQVANKIMLIARTKPVEETRRPIDGLTLFYTDLDRTTCEIQRIDKMGRKCVDSNAVFIDGLEIPVEDRIGEEGKGFRYLLHGLNPERILIASGLVGLGKAALQHATQYAQERVVFDRPIGQNQSVAHPLAESWVELEAANLMVFRAAAAYDSGEECGAYANAAKYFAAEATFKACQRAVMTHGGMGYAKEYHVERYLRECMIHRLAPISPQLILCFIAEKVLGLPKSY